jgi:hypothetical protein
LARTPRLSPRFLARRSALGIIKHSPESRAIAATIVALCASETLPGPGDAMTLLEPADARGVATLVHVRRVRGLNLWIWYFEAGEVLELATLTDRPPGT